MKFLVLVLILLAVEAHAGLWGDDATSIVYQADCSTITAGFCTDTDDGVLYFWNGTTVATSTPGLFTWPDAGVPVSTGSAWGTSIAASSLLVGDCTAGPCLDGSADGGNYIKLYAGTGSYWTALQGGTPAANRSWRLPIAAPPGAGITYLMNMDEYGQMGFVATDTYLTPTGSGASLTVDASGFNGNLATTDNTLQEIADAVDNLAGTGTDDQTASEVAITDAGTFYTTDNVEAALQQVGVVVKDSWTGTLLSGQTTHKSAIQTIATELDNAVEITEGTGIDITAGVISVTADTYQAYDADLTSWAAIPPATGNYETSGTIQGKMVFNSYTAAQTLTAADHNASIVQMTTADEVTMWDCETANVGDFVLLWARDAEKIEVVPASGDHFNLFAGTALTANNELDMAATAGTKVTLMCTADDTWSVYSETAASTDGGAAD